MVDLKKIISKSAQDRFFEIDPEMLTRLLQDYLKNVDKKWNYILPTELYEYYRHGVMNKMFFIVDLRKPEDYAKGHIPGAINIFWLDLLKPENLKILPIDKKILLYCYLGHTSSQVMVLLSLLGYSTISLKFGLGISPVKGVPVAGWLNYGFDLVC